MRARFWRTLLVLFVSLIVGCSQRGADPSNQEKLQAAINADWTQYQQTHSVPGGGLAVYLETPSGNYFASCGMPVGVDRNSRFRIASNTKTFTAAAIMLLAQEGRLNIDDTIISNIPGTSTPYVPSTAAFNIPYRDDITIRQLLSHTSGVYDVTNDPVPATCAAPYGGQNYVEYVLAGDPAHGVLPDPNHQFSPDEWAGVDTQCQLTYLAPGQNPGDVYKYSNTGYSLLAIIIERVAGLPYDQFVIQNLIAPNSLGSTSVPMLATDRTMPAPFTRGYRWAEGVWMDVTDSNMSMNIAEGNIISTPADLARWIKRLIKGQAGPNAASVAAMETQTPVSIPQGGYGLGLTYTAGLGYGHTGVHEGYLSAMLYDPATDVAMVVYFNVWDYANLMGAQMARLKRAAEDARAAVGY